MENVQDDPAWMVCEDLLTRAKDELILEAIDLLHARINDGSVSIDGYVVTLPDRSQEVARDIFVINNLLSEQSQIRDTYARYIKERSGDITAKTVENVEKMKRFLLFLDELSMLMYHSDIFGDWITEAWQHSKLNDISLIIANTMIGNEDRTDAVKFILNNATFIKEEVFTADERVMFEKALALSDSQRKP